MGNYTLIISKDAQKEISYFYKLGDKAIIKKLENFLEELIYEVNESIVTVFVISASGHYGDS